MWLLFWAIFWVTAFAYLAWRCWRVWPHARDFARTTSEAWSRLDEARNLAEQRSAAENSAALVTQGVAVALLLIDRRLRVGHGRLFALYVALYGSGRFVIEHMRTDEAYTLGPLRLRGPRPRRPPRRRLPRRRGGASRRSA